MGNTLKSNDTLVANASITSLNGRYQLIMQPDGNLVLKDLNNYGHAVWQSNTTPYQRPVCVMQGDGDLVLKSRGSQYWDSGTSGRNGAYLVVLDTGHAVIYDRNNTAIWDNGTLLGSSIVSPLNAVRLGLQQALRELDRAERALLQARHHEKQHGASSRDATVGFDTQEEPSGVSHVEIGEGSNVAPDGYSAQLGQRGS